MWMKLLQRSTTIHITTISPLSVDEVPVTACRRKDGDMGAIKDTNQHTLETPGWQNHQWSGEQQVSYCILYGVLSAAGPPDTTTPAMDVLIFQKLWKLATYFFSLLASSFLLTKWDNFLAEIHSWYIIKAGGACSCQQRILSSLFFHVNN